MVKSFGRSLGMVFVGLLFLVPRATYAHGFLKSSVPSAKAQLSVVPAELWLTFSEIPEIAVSAIELRGPSGSAIELDTLRLDPGASRTLVAPIRGALRAGTYTVLWRTASADGHPVQGRYTFVILPNASGLAEPAPQVRGEAAGRITPPGVLSPPDSHHDAGDTSTMSMGVAFDAESSVYVVVRWMQFVSLLTLIGTITFYHGVLESLRRGGTRDPRSRILPVLRARAAAVGQWAAIGLIGTAIVRLYMQSYAMHGAEKAFAVELLGTMLRRTVWGWGWSLQVVAALVAAIAFGIARRDSERDDTSSSRGAWLLATAAALLTAFTPALSGHAVSAPKLVALAVIADGLHVFGASGWLGTLLFLVVLGVPATLTLAREDRGSAVSTLVHAFSPIALTCAGIVALTGFFAGWIHIGTIAGVWQTGYGRTLLLKLAVLSAVVAIGAYNWLRVKPALGDEIGTARIRRSASVELVVGAVVLLITAVLVATPPTLE